VSLLQRRKCILKQGFACLIVLLSIAGICFGDEGNTATSSPVENTNNCNPDGTETCGDEGNGDPAATNSPLSPNTNVGNPIDFLTGNKYQREVDLSIPASPLQLVRHYNSNKSTINSGFGRGWTHSFETVLKPVIQNEETIGFELVQSTGKVVRFESSEPDADGNAVFRAHSAFDGYIVRPDANDDSNHTWIVPDGRRLSFYGSYLVRIDYPGHQFIKLFYSNGRLSEISDETNRLIVLNYAEPTDGLVEFDSDKSKQPVGHIASLTLPNGSTVVYQYDANKNLSSVRYPDGTSRIYHYEDKIYFNHLTGITDRTGVRFSTWRYDDMGRGVQSEHAGGTERVMVTYPDMEAAERGELVTTYIENSLGEQSTYTWQHIAGLNRPQLLSSDGPGCATCPTTGYSYNYDQYGRLADAIKVSGGQSTGLGSQSFSYDELNRVVEIRRTDETGAVRIVERREYESDDSLQAIRTYYPSVNPGGERVVEVVRDESGLPLSITESGWSPEKSTISDAGLISEFIPIEKTTRLEYKNGQLVSVDGPRTDVQDTARFEWDALNRLTAVRLPDNPEIRITEFDSLGRAIEFIKSSASQRISSPITFTYDEGSRVSSVTHLGRTLKMRYDAEGRLTGVVNRIGREMRLAYDSAGQLIEMEYVGGQRFSQKRDTEGRVVEQTLMDQYGDMLRTVSAYYDGMGRVASVTQEATVADNAQLGSALVDFQYDQKNRASNATNRLNGASIGFAYNDTGDLAGVENSAGKGVKLGYDVTGRLNSLTDDRNNETQYIADDFGQVVAAINQDTGKSLYDYDAAGNRTQWTSPEGISTKYSWDPANRIERITNIDGVTWFEYDDHSGLLAATGNKSTTERFTYSNDSQLLSHKRMIGTNEFVTEYQYDDKGRMTSRQLPDGQFLRYHYYQDDEMLGRLRAVTRSRLFGLQQEVLFGEIDENSLDGITGFVSHNGKRTTRSHASDGRITGIEVSDTLKLGYEYDDHGRITGVDSDGDLQLYSYSNGYLTSATGGKGDYVFEYDLSGNRVGSTVTSPDGEQVESKYNYVDSGGGNRMLSTSDSIAQFATELEYNESGAPVARGTLQYEYDINRRPIRVFDNNAIIAEYFYNSFGERIKKITHIGGQSQVQYFLYDGHRISAVVSENSSLSFEHTIYLDGKPTAQLIGESAYAIHTDRLGTAHILSDEYGEIVWRSEYSPFGRAKVLVDSITFNHRLPGHYEDNETGTYYNYQRDYDPDTGRYLTSDPISINGGLNTYLYASADPLNNIDVLGLRPDDSASAPISTNAQGALISQNQYIELSGYIDGQQPVAYFEMLFELTNHGIYKDFADSYSGGYTTAGMALLREMFLTHGIDNIRGIACSQEHGEIFLVPEIGMFSSIIFNAQGIGRATSSFVQDGAVGLWNLGKGLINFTFDSTLGAFYDVQNMLADYYGVDALRVTGDWVPSYQDAVQTVDDVLSTGLEVGANIIQNHELIWQGIQDDFTKNWAERRYGETLTGPFLELGSMFVGAGAALKLQRAKDVLVTMKRADTVNPGQFDKTLTELKEAFRDDPDALEQAAREVGLYDELMGFCSFSGDTLVMTSKGYKPIREIVAGVDLVLAKDEYVGDLAWRQVTAHYSNQYEEFVRVTVRDTRGELQSIVSNRIHPYFAYRAASVTLVSSSLVQLPSKGHSYSGPINGGSWIDAQHLKSGDRLLGADGDWQIIENIEIELQSFKAFNLTVDEFATFFVAGNKQSAGVWVHNTCYGYTNQFPSVGAVNNRADQSLGLQPTGQNLANNMERVGFVRPPGTNSTAHHIIAHGDNRYPSAQLARDLVNDLDPPFDMNEAANGVFLPQNSRFPDDTAPNHLTIHTELYYNSLYARLRNVPKDRRRAELQKIAKELAENKFPY
jgi:RHS repeat-associated protein